MSLSTISSQLKHKKKMALMVQSLTKTETRYIFTNDFFTPKYCKHIMGQFSKLSMTVQFIFRCNFVPRTIPIHMQVQQLIKKKYIIRSAETIIQNFSAKTQTLRQTRNASKHTMYQMLTKVRSPLEVSQTMHNRT